jgi:hypothetical protein
LQGKESEKQRSRLASPTAAKKFDRIFLAIDALEDQDQLVQAVSLERPAGTPPK